MSALEKFQQIARGLSDLPQVSCPLTHHFANGMYMREIMMPAGTVVISRIHLTKHPFAVTKGDVSVMRITELGQVIDVQRIRGPYWGITEPGTCRILKIHEDTTWVTFHMTDEREIERLEDELTLHPIHELDCELIKQLREAA